MLVHPFYGQTSTLTVWACGKQNLTLGRKGGGGVFGFRPLRQ